jgi:Txe/YoeB family toxin of Txe-Axe toxin-antitoxin module
VGKDKPSSPYWLDLNDAIEHFLSGLTEDVALRISELMEKVMLDPYCGIEYVRPVPAGLYSIDFEKTYQLLYRVDEKARSVYFYAYRTL